MTPEQMEENPIEQLTYEQAYAELEQIVRMLEAGERSLDDSVRLYERGQALAQRCAALLDKAELKVRLLAGENLEDFTS